MEPTFVQSSSFLWQFIKSGFEAHNPNRDGLCSPLALATSYGTREHAQGHREMNNVMLELEEFGVLAEMHLGFTGWWCMCSDQGNGNYEFELCIAISQINIVELQSSGSEAMTSIFFSHKSSAFQYLDSCHKRQYKLHPAYLQVIVPQTKTFQKHLKKIKSKKSTLNNFTSWLVQYRCQCIYPSNLSTFYLPWNYTWGGGTWLKVNLYAVIPYCITSRALPVAALP